MPSTLELAVILTTYQRPKHLERSLASLALQRGMAGRFEVVVADDGSKDRTHEIVHRYSRQVDFPLKLVTHPHNGFRVAQCRNDGVRASTAPYLLFSDSDCLFPPDHLEKHLAARRPRIIRAGNSFRLDQEATARVDAAAIESAPIARGFRPQNGSGYYRNGSKSSTTNCCVIRRSPSSQAATSAFHATT